MTDFLRFNLEPQPQNFLIFSEVEKLPSNIDEILKNTGLEIDEYKELEKQIAQHSKEWEKSGKNILIRNDQTKRTFVYQPQTKQIHLLKETTSEKAIIKNGQINPEAIVAKWKIHRPLPSPPQKKEVAPPLPPKDRFAQVPEDAILSKDEFNQLNKFINEHKDEWAKLSKPQVIIRTPENKLPRSLIYYPDKSKIRILLKTHGDPNVVAKEQQELGRGGYKVATNSLDWTTLKIEAFATIVFAKINSPNPEGEEEIRKDTTRELAIAKQFSGYPTYFMPMEDAVEYEGMRTFEDDDTGKKTKEPTKKMGLSMPLGEDLDLLFEHDDSRIKDTKELLKFLHHIAVGFSIMHREGVGHFDIKPGNILVSEGNPLITDFGFTKKFTHDDTGKPTANRARYIEGSDMYFAPEMYERVYVGKTDVFSFMVMAYQLFMRDLDVDPFKQTTKGQSFTIKEKFEQFKKDMLDTLNVLPKDHANIKDKLRALIDECIQYDYKQRPSMEEVTKKIKAIGVSLGMDPKEFPEIPPQT